MLEIEQMGVVRNDFIKWSFDAELKIGSSLTFTRKECYVDIENNKGCLPKDVLWVWAFASEGQQLEPSQKEVRMFGNGITGQVDEYGRADVGYFQRTVNNYYASFGPQKFSVQNGKIHLENMVSGRVAVSYQGVCLDENGYPLVNELHVPAIEQFLVFMHSQREYLRQRMPEHIYRNMERRWKELCGQAYADDETPNPMELRALSGIWNNMLPLADLANF
jgi:hypothetical protein